MNNSLFVTAASASADALRRFLRLDAPGRQQLSEVAPGAEVDAGAVILNSKVGGGRIGPSRLGLGLGLRLGLGLGLGLGFRLGLGLAGKTPLVMPGWTNRPHA